ncbi:MAG: ABC transporter permease [Verrucomicrobia bacterium]|nr:MAG: ABC transporter permease [Verrucomicrobiota bacterium]
MTEVTVIRASQPWWRINFRELWEYRDLMGIMARRDLTSAYKQSVLGPAWFVLQPLLTTLVFTVVFSNIAGIGTNGIPPLLFYMSGMLIWNFFATCMNSIAGTLTDNVGLFGKVYFPRLSVPVVKVMVTTTTAGLNFLMFLGFWAYYLFFTDTALPAAWHMLLLLPILAYAAMLGIGMGLLLSSMTIKYRDLNFFLPFFSMLWMYASPIIYPASMVPERWQWVILYNPMSWAVEATRRSLAGQGTFSLEQVAIGVVSAVLLLVVGLFVFNRVQRTFVDIV